MGGSARRITIEFLGNTRDLNSALDSSASRTSTWGAKLKSAGKVAALGLAAGAVVAGKALFDMTKAAAEDQASQVRLAQTLKNTTGATDEQVAKVEDWISAQGRALGVADDELRPALQRLAEATGDVGQAQDLAQIAMDASAGTGKSLKTVSEALAKAQNGNIGALSRLGIETKNAKGETLTFEQATRKMADTFKGQAEAKAGTLEGKMGRLKLIFDETKEAIGAKLIPAVTQMADWFLEKGLPAVEAFGGWLQENLGPIFQRIGDVISRVTGGMKMDTGGAFATIRDIITGFVDLVRSRWARFGNDLLRIMAGAWRTLGAIIGGALKIIRGIIKVVGGLLKGDWKRVWSGIKDILSGALRIIVALVKQAINVVKTVFRAAGGVLKDIMRAAWNGLVDIIRTGAGKIVAGVKAIPGKLRALGGLFRDAGKWIIDKFVDGIKNAAGIIGGIVGNVWDALRGLINGAIDRINSALEFTIHIPGPDITINPPNIPHMAKGGVVRRPTLALIGEDGPEAVVPLNAKNAPRGRLGIGGGGVTVVVQGNLFGDDRAIARELLRLLRSEERRSGQIILAGH